MAPSQAFAPAISEDSTNPAILAGTAAGIALGLALGIFSFESVSLGAAIVLGVAMCVARPTLAVAFVLFMLPMELTNLQFGPVGLTPMQIAGLFVMIVMAASTLTRGRLLIRATPLDVPVMLWVAVGFLSSIDALDPASTIKKAGMNILLAALFYLAATYTVTPRRMTMLMHAVVYSSAMVGTYAVWVAYRYITTGEVVFGAVFIRSEGMSVPRAAGAVGNPNGLASLMVIAIPIALAILVLAKSWRSKIPVLLATAILVACLGFTFSRGGWLGAIASLMVLGWDRRFWTILLIAALLFAALAPGVVLQRVATSTQFERVEIYSRFDYWQSGLMMFLKRPLLGVGLNNFPANFKRLPMPQSASQTPVHAHNLVINLLAENGAVGLLVYFLLMLSSLVYFLRGRTRSPTELASVGRLAIAASLVGFLAQQLTEVLLMQPTLNIVLWIVLGLGVALSDPDFGKETLEPGARELAAEPS